VKFKDQALGAALLLFATQVPAYAADPAVAVERAWTISAGAIFLNRSSPSGDAIATQTNGGASILDGDELDFEFQPGFDLRASGPLRDGWGLDLRYFDVRDLTADLSRANAGLINIGGVNVGGAGQIDYESRTDLNSIEMSLTKQIGERWQILGGFRYIGFDDEFNADFSAGGPALLTYTVNTDNDLYGVQLGATGLLLDHGRFTVDGYGKVGIYYNDIDRSTGFFPPAGAPIFPSALDDDAATFAADIGVNAGFQITDRVALRAGYQFLWLSNVAESSNQGAAFGGNPMEKGDTYFHGATLGVAATF
jgi:hypothetical protein